MVDVNRLNPVRIHSVANDWPTDDSVVGLQGFLQRGIIFFKKHATCGVVGLEKDSSFSGQTPCLTDFS